MRKMDMKRMFKWVMYWLILYSCCVIVYLKVNQEPDPVFVSPAQRNLEKCAWVTLLTSPDYVDAAVVLAKSLAASETRVHTRVLLTTAPAMCDHPVLKQYYSVQLIEAIPFDNPRWKLKQGQERFQLVLSKLRIFQMEQYERIVYLDADCLVLRNIDDLFLRDEPLVALHPGKRRPYVINAGVMSFKPDNNLFEALINFFQEKPELLYIYDQKASSKGQLKNPDQALLNGYFRHHRLPIGYLDWKDNLSAHKAGDSPRVVHFTTKAKPWLPNYYQESNPFRRQRFDLWRKFL